MANQQLKGPRYKYASIDTAPGSDGYWSEPVSMISEKTDEIFFSRSGGGSATISLQFKPPYDGASWQDYEHDLNLDDGVRCILEDHGARVRWRAGVKSGGYSSGTVVIGFDW